MFTLIKNSLANLKGHKLRLFVAFMWIIVGMTSIIFVSGIGNAMSDMFKSSFETIEPRTAVVFFKPESGESPNLNTQLMAPFDKSDIEILAVVDGVEKVEASKKPPQNTYGFNEDELYADMVYFNKMSFSLLNVGTENHYKIIKGRALTPSDENRNVVVITDTVALELFGDANANDMNYMDFSDSYINSEGESAEEIKNREAENNVETKKLELEVDPIGKGLKIQNTNYEIVGICDSELRYDPVEKKFVKNDPISYMYNEPSSYVPEKVYNILTGKNLGNDAIKTLKVTAVEGMDIKTVSNSVIDTLYSLHPDIAGSYDMQDQSSIQKSTEAMTRGMDKFVVILTIVAMLLGGIGIMNIMYVSVMERNKEIGIRRALGAKPRSIMFQFLIESMFITFMGGLMGLPIGYAVTIYSKYVLPFKPIPSFNSLLYAILMIVVTGIISGLVPAYKAAKVDPVKTIYK